MSEYSKIESLFGEVTIMDGPLENLWGGGGGGPSTKIIFAQGKIKCKKIHACLLTLNIFMRRPKKIFVQGI